MKSLLNLCAPLCAILLIASSCQNLDCNELEPANIPARNARTAFNETIPHVSSLDAEKLAHSFFNIQTGISTIKPSSVSSPAKTTVRDIRKNGTVLMYAVNYSDGGFALISATRDYYPVLAYSEVDSFDISSLSELQLAWLEETQESIINSKAQTTDRIASMNRLWRSYEDPSLLYSPIQRPEATRSSAGEAACYERCDELFMQYGGEGWNFLPLSMAEDIFMQAGQQDYYDRLVYSSNFNHSNPEYSVVGWRSTTSNRQNGPLLETHWHQSTPFNDLCNGKPAGCAAIALAQVMYYHKFPAVINHAGTIINMETLAQQTPSPTSLHKDLINYTGAIINTHYANFGSWTTTNSFIHGIRAMGYTVTKSDLIYFDMEQEVLQRSRPVILLANKDDFEWAPGSAQYVNNGHYWVCDGARDIKTDILEVFTEWQPYGNGNFIQGWNSITNPESLGGCSQTYYHMNWGNGYNDPIWYIADDNRIEYQYSKTIFYISH